MTDNQSRIDELAEIHREYGYKAKAAIDRIHIEDGVATITKEIADCCREAWEQMRLIREEIRSLGGFTPGYDFVDAYGFDKQFPPFYTSNIKGRR